MKRELNFQSTPCPSRAQDVRSRSNLNSALSRVTRTTTSSGGITDMAIRGIGGMVVDDGELQAGYLWIYLTKNYIVEPDRYIVSNQSVYDVG